MFPVLYPQKLKDLFPNGNAQFLLDINSVVYVNSDLLYIFIFSVFHFNVYLFSDTFQNVRKFVFFFLLGVKCFYFVFIAVQCVEFLHWN